MFRLPPLVAFLLTVTTIATAADLSSAYVWKPMKIGGGGWVTGLDLSPSQKDVRYVRTDVSGAYRWEPATSSWKQIVTERGMPAGEAAYGTYGGVDSLAGAPGNPDVAYMAYSGKPYGVAEGQVYKSLDRGETWKPTGFASNKVKMEPNGQGRQEGERLAVDPLDENTVYYGSISDGLWVTPDGGASWSRVAGVPAGRPDHGVNTVVFDRGATRGGARSGAVYVSVDGEGIYRSADAGRSWEKISDTAGGPGAAGRARDAEIGPDRTYYVAYSNEDGATGSVWKYSAEGVWSDITPRLPEGGSREYWDLAVNPFDPGQIVVMRHGGMVFVSNDQGATWTYHAFRLTSPRIRWQGVQENYFLSTGEIAFDPFERGKLWFAEGFGVWWADDLGAPEIEWHSASEGIEEACGNDVIAPPGGKPVAAMWDLGAFYFDDVDAYTAVRSQPGFMSAWALDWCAGEPTFVAGVFRSHLDFVPKANSGGFSTDGGRTWTRFAALENGTAPKELEYGVIAVSAGSTDKIVWAPAKGKLPYCTADRGATWRRSSFGGVEKTGFNDHPSPQKPLCADRVLANTFYFYLPSDGVYRSTDGGAHFARVGNPVAMCYNSILKSVPGRAGHLWFAGGIGAGVWRSTDGGATWASLPGIDKAFNVGLGAPRTAGAYPTVYVAGEARGETGIFRSTDEGKTWVKIVGSPLGIFDWIDALDGDKDVFGRVYVGFAGAGFAYGEPAGN